jgi:hypothetical protein
MLAPNDRLTEKLVAGEDIAVLDACQIHTDGTVMLSNGAAATQAAVVHGYALEPAALGEPVTLADDFVAPYGSGLTKGAFVYLSGTVEGGLADAASTGGTKRLGHVMTDGVRIRFFKITG